MKRILVSLIAILLVASQTGICLCASPVSNDMIQDVQAEVISLSCCENQEKEPVSEDSKPSCCCDILDACSGSGITKGNVLLQVQTDKPAFSADLFIPYSSNFFFNFQDTHLHANAIPQEYNETLFFPPPLRKLFCCWLI